MKSKTIIILHFWCAFRYTKCKILCLQNAHPLRGRFGFRKWPTKNREGLFILAKCELTGLRLHRPLRFMDDRPASSPDIWFIKPPFLVDWNRAHCKYSGSGWKMYLGLADSEIYIWSERTEEDHIETSKKEHFFCLQKIFLHKTVFVLTCNFDGPMNLLHDRLFVG